MKAMSLLSLNCFYNPSTTKPSHTFYTVRAKTLAQAKNIGRFGRNYGELQPQYQQRITAKPTIMCRRQKLLGMYSEKDLDLNDEVVAKSSSENSFLIGLYHFTRPYTIIGNILSTASICILASSSWAQVISPAFLWEVLKAVVPVILMNIYVSGINQVYDVAIDKVNKPHLPLASGVMSMELGIGITATSVITSLAMGMTCGSPAVMFALLCLFFVGTLYSIQLPFMRWRKSPFLTAAIIMIMRSVAIPFGYFIHMQKYFLGQPIILSRALIFTSFFMIPISIVNAMSKDIADVEGDKMHGVNTFSITLGPERVFWMCVSILMAAYGGAVGVGVTSASLLNRIVSVLGHFSLASILMYRALQDNHLDNFYMLTWQLFYAECFLFPFMR